MEGKYVNEKIYKNFFEDCSEEYRSLLDEMLKDEKINDVITQIMRFEEKAFFKEAYALAHKMMYIILIDYVVPHMSKKEQIDKWDVIKHLFSEGEDYIANCIIGINSNMYTFTEDEDASEPDKSDVDYIVKENCYLYKLLLNKYGKNE